MFQFEYDLITELDFDCREGIKNAIEIIEKYIKVVEKKSKNEIKLLDNTIRGYLEDLVDESQTIKRHLLNEDYDSKGGFLRLRIILETNAIIYYRYCIYQTKGKKNIETKGSIPKFIHCSKYQKRKDEDGLITLNYIWEISRCEAFRYMYSVLSEFKIHYKDKQGVVNKLFTLERTSEIKRTIALLLIECLAFTIDTIEKGSAVYLEKNEYYLSIEDIKKVFHISEENYRKYSDKESNKSKAYK